ncbi:hypothetical protein M569_10636, partial [Genlisea aurea]
CYNMVTQSWFRNLLKSLKKPEIHGSKDRIAVLAFEASGTMSKLLQLWLSLTDKQVAKLREDISSSVGVKKLVSENDDYIARLICAEMTENLAHAAKAVARMSKKCSDPLLRSFEKAFSDLIKIGSDSYGWQFSWKKMERKLKKMERYILLNSNLYQELEMLSDLEQTWKRMKECDSTDGITLVEYEKKLTWKRQMVKHLKDNSLWNRTYDYTVLMLARSIFTIYGRIGHVFGVNNVAVSGITHSTATDIHNTRRSQSTVFMQSSVHPFENCSSRLTGKLVSGSGPLLRLNDGVNFQSGPLRNPPAAYGKYNVVSFYSGPLSKLKFKSSPVSKGSKSPIRFWQHGDKSPAMKRHRRSLTSGSPEYANTEHRSSMIPSYPNSANNIYPEVLDGTEDAGFISYFHGASSHGDPITAASKSKMLNPPPETLGAAALSLHYANLIVFIEKLVASPHLICNDARDDLYNMLPANIRTALRSKLKPYTKQLTASVCDTALAAEWNDAILRILEWLAPLAHNMIKWQSERSFEHQNSSCRTNVLLVQTLFFANQEKTESIITELLIGMNYMWRYGREIAAKSLVGYASRGTVDDYLDDEQ